MSRIGKKPINIDSSIKVENQKIGNGWNLKVSGPLGTLSKTFRPEIEIKVEGDKILVQASEANPKAKSLHGLSRSLIANMVWGVTKGFNKGLRIEGVGFRASVVGDELVLNVGFSHQVKFKAKNGISFEIKENIINVKGIDKEMVGQTAASVRAIKPPEVYKGKGIRYVGEIVKLKPGKAAKGVAGVAGAGTK